MKDVPCLSFTYPPSSYCLYLFSFLYFQYLYVTTFLLAFCECGLILTSPGNPRTLVCLIRLNFMVTTSRGDPFNEKERLEITGILIYSLFIIVNEKSQQLFKLSLFNIFRIVPYESYHSSVIYPQQLYFYKNSLFLILLPIIQPRNGNCRF